MTRTHSLSVSALLGTLLFALTLQPACALGQSAGGIQVVIPQKDPKFGTGQSAKSALQQAKAFLRERDLEEGYDSDGKIFVAVGVSSFALPKAANPDDKRSSIDWIRQDAFLIALMEAKRKMAEFMGTTVSAMLERRVRNGSAGRLAPPEPVDATVVTPSTVDKLDRLLQAEVDKRLAEVDPAAKAADDARAKEAQDQAAAAKAADERRKDLAKKLVLDQDFKATVELFCRAEVGGTQSYRTFESIKDGSGQVAVVLVTNETSRDLARALLGRGRAPTDLPAGKVGKWAETIGDDTLLYTHGAHMRTNEKGEVVLVAFGQATPLFDEPELEDAARREAVVSALLAARLFVGDMVESETSRETGSTIKVYADRSRAAQDDRLMCDRIRLKAEALDIQGEQERYSWSLKHPQSEATTQGCVLEISLSAAEEANELRKLMDDLAPSKGGAGVTTLPESPSGGPAGGSTSGSAGAGAEGQLLNRPKSRGGAGAPGRF